MKNERITNQAALDFAMYMILESNFDNIYMKGSPFYEKSLYIGYKECKLTDQYYMEDLCIRFVEEQLVEELPEGLFHEPVVLCIHKQEDKNNAMIQILGDGFRLEIETIRKNNKKMAAIARYFARGKEIKKMKAGLSVRDYDIHMEEKVA